MSDERDVIDGEIFQELRKVMATELENLVRAFILDGERRIQTLREAAANPDPETFRETAHSFKGSSSNLGATRLAKCCARLQETLPDDPQVPELLEELGREFARACRALEGRL